MPYTAQFSKFDRGEVFAIGGIGGNQCYLYDSALRQPFASDFEYTEGSLFSGFRTLFWENCGGEWRWGDEDIIDIWSNLWKVWILNRSKKLEN